jgi:hypothetical protein
MSGSTSDNTLVLKAEYPSNTYTINNFQMGITGTSSDSCQEAGFVSLEVSEMVVSSLTQAMVSLNFQGIGLPNNFFKLTVDYLQKFDANVATDLVCETSGQKVCSLKQSCESYRDSGLWDVVFYLELDHATTDVANHTLFSLETFAMDNSDTGMCDLML